MPKWIKRWAKRVRGKFPECAVRCEFKAREFGYLLEIYYPKDGAWSAIGNWHIWGIILNGSHSPAVRQNRKSFREYFDGNLRQEIIRMLGD